MARDQRLIRVFFALLTVVYLGVFPYLQSINNPNENTRVYLVMALVDHGTWALDDVVRRYGWTNDMAKVPDAKAPGGSHLAAVKGPAMAYVGVPVYVAQKSILRVFGKRAPDERSSPEEASAWLRTTTLTLELFCVHIPCLLFLVWMERRLRRFASDVVLRLSAVTAVGLGSNYLAYSFVFVSHATSAAAVFVALELVAEERLRSRGSPARARPIRALYVGVAAGLVTLLEYQGLFLTVILSVYALTLFRAPRTFGAFAAGGLASVVLLCLFQWGSFGNAFTPGHRMMENAQFGALVHKGFLGFTGVDGHALWELAFSGAFGLFATTPFHFTTALSPLVSRRLGALRVHRERVYVLAASMALVVGLLLVVAASVIWRGGWTIGPRYLTSVQTVLALVGLAGLVRLRRISVSLARGLAVGLAAASFAQTGLVSLLVSTLPESIVRPLPQIALPFLRARLVPHHAFEWFGLAGVGPYFVVLACALMAVLLPLLAARFDRRGLAISTAITAAVFALAVWPALRMPSNEADHGGEVRALFYGKWEPQGRDKIAILRARAAQDPCVLTDLAREEDAMGRASFARKAREDARACGAAR